MMFTDRTDAGDRLASRLANLAGESSVVLGLPRGGVVVAYRVALALDTPLDVIVVRKLGVPFQPELGMGAIAEEDVRVLNDEIVRSTGVTDGEIEDVERLERAELERRAQRYRGGRLPLPLAGRTAIVVDDGIATGSTAKAACRAARRRGAARVVLAVPVAPRGWDSRVGGDADEFVCLETPEFFYAIGQFYEDFSQTSDDEVVRSLARATGAEQESTESAAVPSDPPLRDEDVVVETRGVRLEGHLTVPERARGIVVFAHGSGSSRHSPRNRYVASVLQRSGIGTLLFDLLTVEEELDRANVFDIELLAHRLADVAGWIRAEPCCTGLAIGYFGASTGAGAALWAAAEPGAAVAAVVSRGGRPDLAGSRLERVTAPTLLIVGARDDPVVALNRQALARLGGERRLLVVPGATHLFEEPGTLEAAAEAAQQWFSDHLPLPQFAEERT